MQLQKGDAWLPQAFQGTTRPDEGGGESSKEMGGGVFEEVGSGMSGGRGEEEDHVEGHRVGSGPPVPRFCTS